MALDAAIQSSHRVGQAGAKHSLELYLCTLCPFSAKQFNGVTEHLLPLVHKQPEKLNVILRQYPMPWQAPSASMHQALLAVSQLKPSGTWDFTAALFKHQAEFSPPATADETERHIRERLADLAVQTVGVDKAKVLELTTPDAKTWGMCKVDVHLKKAVKLGRQQSIHVTPTCLVDGLIAPQISSSFGKEEWHKFFDELE